MRRTSLGGDEPVRATTLANTTFEANDLPTARGPRRRARGAWFLASVALLTGCAGTDTGADEEVTSRLETEPPGATVFVDGSFVGITPTTATLPAKRSVHVRLELTGYQTLDTMLDRRIGIAPDAPPGAGWETVYYWQLVRK